MKRMRAPLQADLSSVDAAHLNSLADDAMQPVCLLVDDRQKLVLALLCSGISGDETGNRGLDRGERRLQIVSQSIQHGRAQLFTTARGFGGRSPLDRPLPLQ